MNDDSKRGDVDAEIGEHIYTNSQLVRETDFPRERLSRWESEIADANRDLRTFAEHNRRIQNQP